MGEINNYMIELEFWTRHSREISVDLLSKMETINNILSKDSLSADSDIYVKLRNLEPSIDELFEIVINT